MTERREPGERPARSSRSSREDRPERDPELRAKYFKGRGELREGNWADIVVFDPEKVQDTATYKDPHHYPTGIPYVLVNGVLVIKNGEHTGAKAGQALRHICDPKG